ncbi:MAG: zinc dependent phospholipase C family protein [Planctomycetes bacterium]|nr:zinc dependent phospholipase C family protein [Planctomycetota bacterium]
MLLTILCVLVVGALAVAAWGPGMHLEFAERVHRRRRELLPADVARLIDAERAAYDYGNIAADIINFKAYGGAYSHCHRWSIVEEMRELATSPRQEAFVLGYLSHLAADTIAHNHFVPYHLARYARTKGLGHLYWELNADRFVPESRWARVGGLKNQDALEELDDLVNRTVPRKALSMGTNKVIFNHVLLVSERERWRGAMARLHPMSRVTLEKGFLGLFQAAAVDRIRLALHPRGFRAIQRVDANGHEAQQRAMKARLGLLHRIAPRRVRAERSEARARPFLEGMQSPPP